MALHTAPKPARTRRRLAVLGWAAVGVAAVLVAILVLAFGLRGAAPAPAPVGPVSPAAVQEDPAAIAKLPLSGTYTALTGLPADPNPSGTTDGIVAHPVREAPVSAAPGGPAVARIEPRSFGDTWLPVIATKGDWLQVLLPSRPDGSAGWVRAADVRRASTPYLIRVHLHSFRMELVRNGVVAGSWTVGTGKSSAPTPAGRTFLLGAFTDAKQKYSPVILPLGTHSPTHDTFGGGPGTVAIHTWPTSDVFGTASSDGCIRVPADALDRLTEVPLGTLVMIDER